jgi:CBS domain-containing protein
MPEELANEHVDMLSPRSSTRTMPIGIITKSDILLAYHNLVGIDDPCEVLVTKDKPLQTCNPNIDRDRAAAILLERNHTHHILVVDDEPSHASSPYFVGLFSSWDLSAECARDDRAWPWI